MPDAMRYVLTVDPATSSGWALWTQRGGYLRSGYVVAGTYQGIVAGISSVLQGIKTGKLCTLAVEDQYPHQESGVIEVARVCGLWMGCALSRWPECEVAKVRQKSWHSTADAWSALDVEALAGRAIADHDEATAIRIGIHHLGVPHVRHVGQSGG